MTNSTVQTFHYPRWPLIKRMAYCLLLIAFGLLFFLVVEHVPLKLLGLTPMLGGLLFWRFGVHAPWTYQVAINGSALRVNHRSYPWSNLAGFNIDFKKERKRLRLAFASENGLDEVIVGDAIENFPKLAETCLWYFNHTLLQRKQDVSDACSRM